MSDSGGWGWLLASIYALPSRNPESNRIVVEAAQLAPDDHVLDIGCGAGAAVERAAKVVTTGSVSAVDPTERMVTIASRRVPEATVKQGGAEAIPFEDDRFTVAWAIAAFHHWADQDAGLAEARRVLAPGGRLLIAEALLKKRGSHGLDEQGIARLEDRMRRAGFEETSNRTVKAGRRMMTIITAR